MRDTVELAVDRGQEPVEFWFGKYLVSIRFNTMLLGYDADIYYSDGVDFTYVQTVGGKSVKQALESAKKILLDRV